MPGWPKQFLARLRSLFHRDQLDRDLDDELAFHLAQRTDKNRAGGMDAAEAHHAAHRQLGNPTHLKEETRNMRTLPTVENLAQDVRYGGRTLLKTPLFALIAVATLALGIGASTAIFSVVNSVLLRPLPYAQPERLVQVWETNLKASYNRNVVNPVNFLDWTEQNHSFSGMAAILDTSTKLGLGQEPLQVPAILVSPQFLSVLGVAPMLGNGFAEGDGKEGDPIKVILTYEFWQQQFGGDPKVVGRQIRNNERPATIIGVMPRGFALPNVRGSVFLPYAIDRSSEFAKQGRYMMVVARLKPGVTLAQASEDMNRVAEYTVATRPNFNTNWGALVLPMLEDATRDVHQPLLLLLGAVGFVLLIACANVANLLLMRGAARERELAVRVAIGASRSRVICQLLAENLLLSALGTLGGLAIAQWGLGALLSLIPEAAPLPRMNSIRIDSTVFLFALTLTFGTTLLFGLLPALRLSRIDLFDALKQGTSRTGVGSNRRVRQALMVAEIALALMLSVGAGLLLRSFQRLTSVNLGFRTDNLVTMRVFVPDNVDSVPVRARYLDRLVDAVRKVHGVEAAGFTHFLPLMDRVSGSCFALGAELPKNEADAPDAQFLVVSSHYFDAMRTPLLTGRDFDEHDKADATTSVIVNQAFVQKFLDGKDAVGQQVSVCWTVTNPGRIVGVVGNARQTRLKDKPVPTIFLANSQAAAYGVTLVIRTADDPNQIIRPVETAIHDYDPQQAISEVQTMEHVFSDSASEARFQLVLLLIFAGLAIVLSMIGVYGVVSYSVTQRTPEIGVRMAMGADTSQIARMVLREALLLAGLAVGIGLAGALALTRVMESLLYETTPNDPATLAISASAVLVVAAAAALVPARRATRVDPLVALRYE
ncbi:MAG: ABC transporter permease [Acidobacteria bacterium]|nr:ABC transporter permease [Acidobacteriota bacterium]